MRIEYLRTSRRSYMIVKDADYIFENYELQMILHNDISSLLDMQVIIGDGAAEYWYDVTGMQSLEKQFSVAPVREKQMRFLLQNLIEMKRVMEEYLLDDLNICFSVSMIYYDRFSDRIRFCYIPGLAQQGGRGIGELFEELLQYLDHSDPMAVRMGYDMYERSMQSEFITEDCIECLTNHVSAEGMKTENEPEFPDIPGERGREGRPESPGGREGAFRKGENSPEREEVPEQSAYREQELEYLQQETAPRKGHRRKRRREKRRNFVDYSEILDEEQRNFYAAEEIPEKDYTECFMEEDTENQWELIYKGDGLESDLRLTELPCLIGTDDRKVQGVLHSRTVSRVHARIYEEEHKLYLEDYNSTNGTYLNHRLIPMNTPMELKPGDRVVFATEEFMVHCRRVPKQD